MKHINEERVELYKLAYEEIIEETANDSLAWDERKERANEYAKEIVPSVGEACGVVMKWRHASIPPPTMTNDEVTAVNRLLRWKTEIAKRNDGKPYARGRHGNGRAAEISLNNDSVSETIDQPSVAIRYGYITEWYEQWFKEHSKLFARDKELASILNCTPGAFSSARRTLKEMGYEFECVGGVTKILKRPSDTARLKEIEKLTSKLDSLEQEFQTAKQQLADMLSA